MSNEFIPDTGKDIRLRFDHPSRSFFIEQARVRSANGTTDPNDLGSILDLGVEGFEKRAQATSVKEAVMHLLRIAYEENAAVRSIDLGPTSPQASEVQAAVDDLLRVTL